MRFLGPFYVALSFLTILPIFAQWKPAPEDMGRSMAFFPLVGLLIGGLLLLSDTVLSSVLPVSVVLFLLIVVLALISGGLHLDGLADTFDGLCGGKTPDEALSIMKDSSVGAIGAAGLIFIIGMKYSALQSVPAGLRPAALLTMPVLSRWSMTLMACLSPYARPSGGTGKDFIGTVSPMHLIWATLFAVFIGVSGMGWKGGLVILFIGGFTLLGVLYFRHRMGGVTGDVLGATNEVNEVMTLLLILVLSK